MQNGLRIPRYPVLPEKDPLLSTTGLEDIMVLTVLEIFLGAKELNVAAVAASTAELAIFLSYALLALMKC